MTELYHHGVPNQKHGVRRYQYYDGTWTPLGKARRRIDYGGSVKGSSNKKKDKDPIQQLSNSLTTYGEKITRQRPVDYNKYASEVDSLSNSELQSRIQRMSLENQYIRLRDERVNVAANKGRELVKDILYTAGTAATITGVVYGMHKNK